MCSWVIDLLANGWFVFLSGVGIEAGVGKSSVLCCAQSSSIASLGERDTLGVAPWG
jgi:hypothetical protein